MAIARLLAHVTLINMMEKAKACSNPKRFRKAWSTRSNFKTQQRK